MYTEYSISKNLGIERNQSSFFDKYMKLDLLDHASTGSLGS